MSPSTGTLREILDRDSVLLLHVEEGVHPLSVIATHVSERASLDFWWTFQQKNLILVYCRPVEEKKLRLWASTFLLGF